MFNYIKGEIYRILHKKSMYIYYGIFAVLYFIIVFVFSKKVYTTESIINDAENYFTFLPVIVGGYFFAALYTDDLSSKNLTTLVGYGLSKLKIVLSKFLLMTFFSAVIIGLIPVLMAGIYAIFGVSPTAAVMGEIYIYALTALMKTVAFAALSGIVVYGIQRNTFAIVLYVALAFGIVSQLVSLLLNTAIVKGIAPGLDKYLMSGITIRLQVSLLLNEPDLWIFAEYAIYAAIALALSTLAFRKKELEF
ncbi:hypothetical protein FACS1894219_01950 [Clostridia bacterium]|nr:hypothetical protein FACS1894219_01950 [Clostridia bacterium]